MSGKVAKAPSQPASKRERQAAWAEFCRNKGLSAQQRNRAASIFPPGASMKVLRWPSL